MKGINPRIQAEVLKKLDKVVAEKAEQLRAEIITGFRQYSPRGRTYTHIYRTIGGRAVPVARRKKPHTASAPGDIPAIDNGELWQSIQVQKQAQAHYRVGTGENYALYLEYGTRLVEARPFMRPAIQRFKKQKEVK